MNNEAGNSQAEEFLKLFHTLESVRLEACIQRELPGLFREIQQLHLQLHPSIHNHDWLPISSGLMQTPTTANDSLSLASQYLGKLKPPEPCNYHGSLNPDAVAACKAERLAREKAIKPVHDNLANDTLHKYHGLIKNLCKTFEALCDEDHLFTRQQHGDDVDIDTLVEAMADASDGSEMPDRLFTRIHRSECNIDVVFMEDMRCSTKGWTNDAERETLIQLCESLESLGDRYAIYGFSVTTRKHCELFRIKEFDENYNTEIQAHISGINPQDYTRMGFSIRDLCKVLNAVDAQTRILITIPDGKPDDYDHYRG